MVGVVVTGRGGVGKTTLTANLGAYFARERYKTLLIDGDVYLPKLALHFGLDRPRYHLHSLLKDDSMKPEMAIYEIPENRLFVLPGSSHFYDILMIPSERLKDVVSNVMRHFALTIIDSPTGIPFDTLPLFSLVQYQIVVVEIERSPIHSFETLVKNEILKLKALGDLHGLRVGVVINKVRESEEDINSILRFLDENVRVEVLGVIPMDEKVPEAINYGKPVIEHEPSSPAARAFRKVGENLERWVFGRNPGTEFINRIIGEGEL